MTLSAAPGALPERDRDPGPSSRRPPLAAGGQPHPGADRALARRGTEGSEPPPLAAAAARPAPHLRLPPGPGDRGRRLRAGAAARPPLAALHPALHQSRRKRSPPPTSRSSDRWPIRRSPDRALGGRPRRGLRALLGAATAPGGRRSPDAPCRGRGDRAAHRRSAGCSATARRGWRAWRAGRGPIAARRRSLSELSGLIEGLALKRPRPTAAAIHRRIIDVATGCTAGRRRATPPSPALCAGSIPPCVTLAHEGAKTLSGAV